MDKHHGILARDPLRLLHRRKQGDNGKNHGFCIVGIFCRTATSTPKVTTTITRATTPAQPKTTSTTPTQTPAPAITKQATTPVVVSSSPVTSPTSPQTSSTVAPTTDPGDTASDSQFSLTTDATGTQGSNQNSDVTASQELSSFSVYRYLTTDHNGYTIDATSTSFINPAPTSGVGANTNSGTDSLDSTSNGSNVAPIVGGAVGVISFILFVLFAMWFIRRRRKNRTAPSSEFISSRAPFTGSSEFRFRQLDDPSDAQSISEYPFEPTPPGGGTDSPKSFLHMREKSDAY